MDTWVGAGEVFSGLWTHDTVTEEVATRDDIQEELTQLISTPKKLQFTAEGSISKSALVSKTKSIGSTHAYFKPRSNLKLKNKRGMFRTMVFKIYLQLSLPISI